MRVEVLAIIYMDGLKFGEFQRVLRANSRQQRQETFPLLDMFRESQPISHLQYIMKK